ncbi:glutamate synthase large subunit [Xanthomonas citri pv. mangiferaeindicae]|uniref:glutamate synthase large subunit n=1 Tax=Xanthomonas citri TaxID=346 RepID=UPI00025525BE|nr:glutamate synthase large subunit [Xanthomonas citri]OOW54243.1 glutamate synthase subunit alpha [Xanthomonas campestris pv. centellae]UDB88153.1 glutamate synthase large subunit [Xanthomonas citri pv. mangiferaeindicae]UDI79350.1 glutamate synthase subunit alpha [Xanthomonas citri pv. mangiferaeindicae]CCG35257.1 glutamine amidotransferases class-II family protein [Xanthomonas citri pv. mangiferaeindicae LMG 941]
MAPRTRQGLNDDGLYNSVRDERDACGFGMVAQLDDQPSRALVDTAIAALSRMTHRGGVAADGLTGDGCGLLIRKPDAFLRGLARDAGITLGTRYAAGVVFLPLDEADAARCRAELEAQLHSAGVHFRGWRVVPTDDSVCGQLARDTLPRIEQVFVDAGAEQTEDGFTLALFLARRRAEQALHAVEHFYVTTLSPNGISYKGMVLPDKLSTFYPDLQRSDMSSSAIVFHQRFSTNTLPRWPLAHPFRLLAHNGEINTIEGNRRWAQARSKVWQTPRFDIAQFDPVISMHGSDSQSLDNMLELLIAGGMDLLQALRILVPPATQSLEFKDADLAAFYEFYGLNTEPWDGPAGIVACDSRYAACMLDRNGLRPARWMLTSDRHFLVASEAGVWELPAERITRKGKLGPGEMMAIDLKRGDLLDSDAIDRINRARAPYKQWLQQGVTYLQTELIDPSLVEEPFSEQTLRSYHKLFQLSTEEVEQVLRPLAETEQEATGSMGDDTPMAVLSRQTRPLYDYFRQAFAQVTNPPIDPLREGIAMSLTTQLGKETNIFHAAAETVNHVILNSPVLSQRKLRQLLKMEQYVERNRLIDLSYSLEEGLKAGLERICQEVEAAARAGAVMLLLSDRYPVPDRPMAHALLATGAVHHHLCKVGLRCDVNLIIETGTARDPHHMACLLGVGATAVYPYLAYQTLFDLGRRGILQLSKGGEQSQIGRRYRKGIYKGLSKIISKMGICTIASYRGAQLFEIVGLDPDVVDLCFADTPARIGGVDLARLDTEARELTVRAWNDQLKPEVGGLLKYVHGGEYHMYNPDVVMTLQRATRTGDAGDWQKYVAAVHARPASTLRDLVQLKRAHTPTPLDDVAPAEDVLRRFDSAAISLGALSPEAHEALAIAMNRLGGRSNSGEGGEDPARYGTEKRSKIKQVASGRFGVTPEYLVNAEVLQIKVAQGAKPGEGGQLPGHKVNELIARLRYAKPGIGLISPPPHHDIYSIEDLAQLIYDLKQVNPTALVSVKLVAHAGVGTIAAGVVKAGADLITVSGHDGGTGASPVSSIRYAGVPWELGVAESHQALVANDLRERTILQTDGGLKTGLDVVKAALLGADSFGFGTAPMIVLGCKYLRICHLNNCATGVATQDERLRAGYFTGLPERVEHFFRLLAEEVRQWLSYLGVRSLDEIVGRTDLLEQLDVSPRPGVKVDLSRLLTHAQYDGSHCAAQRLYESPDSLATQMDGLLADAIANKSGGDHRFLIHNTDRSIGARLSGAIARAHGNHGMSDAPLNLRFRGTAGQSFGAFNAGGLQLELEGEANDYVGKGMAGGRLVVRPPRGARFEARNTPIVGNTCLYGATGGELFAAGRAGERFAVRNSGALAVVEGAGDHCCEYMTDGVVLVLGKVGLNFGAGFTGGLAYVLDIERDFVDRYNHELIDIHRVSAEGFENHRQHLHTLISRHRELTGSIWAQQILDEFRDYIGKFWLVKPKAASIESLTESLRRAA